MYRTKPCWVRFGGVRRWPRREYRCWRKWCSSVWDGSGGGSGGRLSSLMAAGVPAIADIPTMTANDPERTNGLLSARQNRAQNVHLSTGSIDDASRVAFDGHDNRAAYICYLSRLQLRKLQLPYRQSAFINMRKFSLICSIKIIHACHGIKPPISWRETA